MRKTLDSLAKRVVPMIKMSHIQGGMYELLSGFTRVSHGNGLEELFFPKLTLPSDGGQNGFPGRVTLGWHM